MQMTSITAVLDDSLKTLEGSRRLAQDSRFFCISLRVDDEGLTHPSSCFLPPPPPVRDFSLPIAAFYR